MNIKINLGEILTKAWQITWKFKVLWIFGILAGCGANNGNRYNFNNSSSRNFGGLGDSGQLPEAFRQFQDLQPEELFRQYTNQYLAIIALVILGLCVLWFLFYALGLIGKIGLIHGASQADSGAETLTFGEIWNGSLPYFWRMVGLNLLVGLPFFLLFVILLVGMFFFGFSAFSANPSGSGLGAAIVGLIVVFGTLICVIGLLSLIVNLLVEQAENAIVVENLGILESLGRGWQIFKSGLLSVIIIGLVLGVLNWVIGLVLAIPALLIVVPAAIGTAAAGQNFIFPLALAGLCCAVYLPILLVVNGLLQTYTQSAWTLTYRRLIDQLNPSLPAQVEISAAQ